MRWRRTNKRDKKKLLTMSCFIYDIYIINNLVHFIINNNYIQYNYLINRLHNIVVRISNIYIFTQVDINTTVCYEFKILFKML